MNSAKKWQAVNKQDLILEVWEALDCESVGRYELEQIQKALEETFGTGGQESPASIARLVADEGAVLRHPEVFECDTDWRLRRLDAHNFEKDLDFSDFDKALTSFDVLKTIAGHDHGIARLRDVVSNARQQVLLVARSKIVPPTQRERAKEISQWLSVWLQSSEVFKHWLELRLRSAEFKDKFPDFKE